MQEVTKLVKFHTRQVTARFGCTCKVFKCNLGQTLHNSRYLNQGQTVQDLQTEIC